MQALCRWNFNILNGYIYVKFKLAIGNPLSPLPGVWGTSI